MVPDFNMKEWERSLGEIIEMAAENGGTKEDTIKNLQFITDSRAGINAELQKGTPFGMIPNAVELPEYRDWSGYDWLPMNVWRILLDNAMGSYPWREVDPCVE